MVGTLAPLLSGLLLLTLTSLILCSTVHTEAARRGGSDAGGGGGGFNSVEKRKYVIGAVPHDTDEMMYTQLRPTFEAYMNDYFSTRHDGGVTFELKAVHTDEIHEKVANQEIDFLFSDPALFVCLDLAIESQALATISLSSSYGPIDGLGGTVYVRKDSSIRSLKDLEGRVVGAVSLSSMAAGQIQALAMEHEGLSVAQTPSQLVLMGDDQYHIVKSLLAGTIEAALVKSDVLHEIEELHHEDFSSDLRAISSTLEGSFHGIPYPFPSMHKVYPQWPFFAFNAVSRHLLAEVANALIAIPIGHEASIKGLYHSWEWPLSYSSVRNLQESLQVTEQDGETGQVACKPANDHYSLIHCPEDYFRLPRDMAEEGCANRGLSCPDKSTCFCSPCM